LIDDRRDFPRSFATLGLQLPRCDSEFVDGTLKDANEDDVLFARVLQVIELQDHLARVQTIGAANVFFAGALAVSFRLLFGVTE
jgi:hypothetical protein